MRKGFTLIEMLVSVAIFSIVMVISLGALLIISESDRKAETLKSVTNNLNFSIDSMSRAIRTGTAYHCDITQVPVTDTRDCSDSSGATSIAFKDNSGRTIEYELSSNTAICGIDNSTGCIARSINGGDFSPLTAPEVHITTFSFFVSGSTVGDTKQPRVTMLLSGTIQVTPTLTSQFNLQTTVTQRLYDL